MRRLYQGALAKGLLKPDPRQVVELLSGLQGRLARYEGRLLDYRARRGALDAERQRDERESSALLGGEQRSPAAPGQLEAAERLQAAERARREELERLQAALRKPRGLYLHGNVGTGKTLLMDMFSDALDLRHKRRVHLHDFMLEVHGRIHKWKLAQKKEAEGPGATKPRTVAARASESDGIAEVGKQIAQESTLLAFDEFVVTDVVDALILKHLFSAMLREGCVVVATSNTAPADLYKNGLNYQYFAPFIDLLTAHCKVFDMDSSLDYRMQGAGSLDERYLFPASPENRARFDEVFAALTRGQGPAPREVDVAFGRKLRVDRAAGRVCRFDFDHLCGDREPVMAAADYQALCNAFDAVMIDNVPTLGLHRHNETRRFITLVDQAYDRGVQLFLLAEAGPLELFDAASLRPESDGADHYFSLGEMATASRRMASRLMEMSSSVASE